MRPSSRSRRSQLRPLFLIVERIGRLPVRLIRFLDPMSAVTVGADRGGLAGQLALEETFDHFAGRNVVPLVTGRASRIDLRARVGDIGPGRADVLVVGVGNARSVALRASDALELMGSGQILLHECQVANQAGGVCAQDVGRILSARCLGYRRRTGFRAGCSGCGRPGQTEPDRCHDQEWRDHSLQTSSQWRNHW
jgi:hypothetical protein